MFDSTTAQFIRSGPPLTGLNLGRLPEDISRVFTELVAARVRWGNVEVAQLSVAAPELLAEIERLRRLAVTYELRVAVLIDAPSRRAAAFIAGTSYQLVARLGRLLGASESDSPPLTARSVRADVAAALLLLTAGYPADAIEASADLVGLQDTSVRSNLVKAIAALARGQLHLVTALASGATIAAYEEPEDSATDTLFVEVLSAFAATAAIVSGRTNAGRDPEDPVAFVDRVISRGVQRVELERTEAPQDFIAVSTLAGPTHLARLAKHAIRTLIEASVARLTTPPGLDPERWRELRQHIAVRRPLLWPNHLEAIDAGLLAPGTSAVVSFPTGAGKSTISELKIAATLADRGSVVFLAPTHALVRQTKNTLASVFPSTSVRGSLSPDAVFAQLFETEDAEIAVMTPERGLALVSNSPEGFAATRLIVFDECHLLHASSSEDRRGLDAMICLMRLVDAAPDADLLLLSAMVSNAPEIAEWLAELTGRRCLALTQVWKPTRQARGCLVFASQRLRSLERGLATARRAGLTQAPSVRDRAALTAFPEAVFGLQNTWASKEDRDYCHVTLSDTPVLLGATSAWELSPNKNEVAGTLAATACLRGIKTLVFVQDRRYCKAIAENTQNHWQGRVDEFRPTPAETELRKWAIDDCGGEAAIVAPVNNIAAIHNSSLLPAERRLSERAFARADGVQVLIATPTLAQGMNLPAELVLIAGDKRFDPTAQNAQLLTAHELLNAAGRAGRAGYAAAGTVLVIPDQLVVSDATGSTLGQHWFDLRESVFSKSDQCLAVQDPFDALLREIEQASGGQTQALIDRIQRASDTQARAIRYFLLRVPQDAAAEGENTPTVPLLPRSFAAFKARRNDRLLEFQARADSVGELRRQLLVGPELPEWMERVARAAGVPLERVRELDGALRERGLDAVTSVLGWLEWVFAYWRADVSRLLDVANTEALRTGLSTAEQGQFQRNKLTWGTAVGLIERRLRMWMDGATLCELERELGAPEGGEAQCPKARGFVRECVRELSFATGLVTQVGKGVFGQGTSGEPLPLALGVLGPCVKEGLDSPVLLAIREVAGPDPSRAACRRWLVELGEVRIAGGVGEHFPRLVRRVGALMKTNPQIHHILTLELS